MAEVYLAEQLSLGRHVALKVLKRDLSSQPAMGERFRREAKLLSTVDHPSVVRVIDFESNPRDGTVLVLELADGLTLEQALQQGPFEPRRAMRVLLQLAEGLGAVHALGIIHRDLKPQNIVIGAGQSGEQARLLDFGIARLTGPEDEGSGKGAVTQVGVVLGTPEYVSPEQGMGQPLDARSDLYALGVILFRALTGRHPFTGPTPREFISQHIHQAPPRLLELAPHLSSFPSLVATVEACLEKDPARRPQSATGVTALVATRPVTLSTPLEPQPERAPAPKSRRAWWLVAAGVLLLGAVGAFVSWYAEPVRTARRMLEAGRGSEALQVLDDLGDVDDQPWALRQLRATALHQVGRHDDELKMMSTAPSEGVTLEPLALEALADDYGHTETARLRKLLASFPKNEALPQLQDLARDDGGRAQWGALRFVDEEYAGQGLPLLELYARALEHRDCGVRRVAAKRLADFRSQDAVPALEKLKAVPRKKGEDDCGQAAAEAALEKLARE